MQARAASVAQEILDRLGYWMEAHSVGDNGRPFDTKLRGYENRRICKPLRMSRCLWGGWAGTFFQSSGWLTHWSRFSGLRPFSTGGMRTTGLNEGGSKDVPSHRLLMGRKMMKSILGVTRDSGGPGALGFLGICRGKKIFPHE